MSDVMKKSSFVEGTIIATLSIVIVKILGMFYVIPFYALIGVEGAALYAYAYNIYVIFLDISSAGLPIAISKVINEFNTLKYYDAKVRAYHIGKNLITFISVLVFVLLFLFAPQIAKLILGDLQGGSSISDIAFVIRSVSFALLVIPYLSVTKGYLQGHNIVSVSSFSQLIEQIVRILFVLGGSYLALHVFHLSLTTAVGVAVFGAFAGGISAVIYLLSRMSHHKKELHFVKDMPKDDIANRVILKKIISYAVPFIIIDIAVSIYNFVDMLFLLRTLDYLGYDALQVEYITTSITTWGSKITMIVNSVAMGMSVSLIPAIVESFTLKKWGLVNDKLNKALEIILFLCIPMVIGLSLLAKPVWGIFYGAHELGPNIFAVLVFTSLFFNLYTVTSSTLQSLNKFKTVYFTSLFGFFLNAVLDVPLMLLFHKFQIPAYYGAIVATIIGYATSIFLALYFLYKEHHLSYQKVRNLLLRMIFPTVSMVGTVLFLRFLWPISYTSKFSCVLEVLVISIFGAFVYFFLSYKTGIIEHVFGKEYIQKFISKISFKKTKKTV
jgi:O-antigen/teichoic acid export membrane protein